MDGDDNKTILGKRAKTVAWYRRCARPSRLLCAFDIWLSVLWLYVVVLAIVCVPGIQSIWSHDYHAPVISPNSTAIREGTFETLFGLLFCGAMAAATIALLALFFLREWALVLFLWKLFELGCLLLLLAAYALTHALRSQSHAYSTEIPLLVLLSIYSPYTMLMLDSSGKCRGFGSTTAGCQHVVRRRTARWIRACYSLAPSSFDARTCLEPAAPHECTRACMRASSWRSRRLPQPTCYRMAERRRRCSQIYGIRMYWPFTAAACTSGI